MTTPTQAQIEAAAKAMADYMEAGWVKAEHFEGLAKAALTAAAQVDEQTVDAGLIAKIAVAEKQKRDIAVAEMKERCAQVAESLSENYCAKRIEIIASTIRNLKDAP